jgi:antitoxin component YwqK of YwqJK toxin-antitoxin module
LERRVDQKTARERKIQGKYEEELEDTRDRMTKSKTILRNFRGRIQRISRDNGEIERLWTFENGKLELKTSTDF